MIPEMQEVAAMTSLRNLRLHLPPLKWFPKANKREETTLRLYTDRLSLLSPCLLGDHLVVTDTSVTTDDAVDGKMH